jgi:hypothetical protein
MRIDDVVIEKEEDIFDYVTKGFIPPKDEREILISKIDNGDYDDVLDRPIQTQRNVELILENRIRNLVTVWALAGISFVLGLLIGKKR